MHTAGPSEAFRATRRMKKSPRIHQVAPCSTEGGGAGEVVVQMYTALNATCTRALRMTVYKVESRSCYWQRTRDTIRHNVIERGILGLLQTQSFGGAEHTPQYSNRHTTWVPADAGWLRGVAPLVHH